MKRMKQNAGFTLVELVVVIAILGILAGVGTVGYSGYVKNAQKKADQTLVANIVRAIEVGTNSTMFAPPESLALSATTYPVGFITLNQGNGKVLSSGAQYKDVSGDCVFSDIEQTIVYLQPVNKRFTCSSCGKQEVGTVYERKEVNISYCLTHSQNQPVAGAGQTFDTGMTVVEETSGCATSHSLRSNGTITVTSADLFTTDIAGLHEITKNGVCELVDNAGRTAASTIAQDINTDSTMLAEAVRAAFGNGTNFALQYDGWGQDDDARHDYETFYASATEMFDLVQDQTGLLIDAVNSDFVNGLAEAAGKDLGSYLTEGKYTSSADLMDSFTTFVNDNYTTEEWDNAWKIAATSHEEYAFGLDTKGAKNDFFWAARLGYNASFASYLKIQLDKDANGNPITDAQKTAYIGLIQDYGEDELGGAIRIPSIANTYAFNRTDSGSLYESFKNQDGQGEAVFNRVKELYATYKDSASCTNSGRTFYNTIKTMAETGGIATDAQNGYNGNYFDYYKSYLNEMAGLYESAQAESNNGILIIVTMENDAVKCTVSPSAADLRNHQ